MTEGRLPSPLSPALYQMRRNKLAERLGQGVFLLLSSELAVRSSDNEFEFRQNGHFYYFTGVAEPHTAVIIANTGDSIRSLFLCKPADPNMELWNGPMLGLDGAKALGFDEVYPIADLEKQLEIVLENAPKAALLFGQKKAHELVTKIQAQLGQRRRREHGLFRTIVDITGDCEYFRGQKDSEELALMRQAVAITNQAHRLAMASAKPGVFEYQIEALLKLVYRYQGGQGHAYAPIVAAGVNATILHYVKNDQPLKKGDLLLIDSGAEYGHYAADITRTFPVGGRFRPWQQKIYQIVLDAQEMTIKATRPGVAFKELWKMGRDYMLDQLIALNIFTVDKAKLEEEKIMEELYPHGVGHHLGYDVHDESLYSEDAGGMVKLAAGMVITIEPGLYFPKNRQAKVYQLLKTDLIEQLHGIGVRIEDNILLTETGCENLSKDIPKTVAELELACAQDKQSLINKTFS